MTQFYLGHTGNGAAAHIATVPNGSPAKALCGRLIWTGTREAHADTRHLCRRCAHIKEHRMSHTEESAMHAIAPRLDQPERIY